MLRETPYTQKEAEAAVGLRTDNGTRAAESSVKNTGDATVEEQSMEVEHVEREDST